MADNKKFRYEKKYLLDRDSALLLKQRISYVLSPDNAGENGSYHISSLYFDDQYNTAFYEKQNGVLKRNKFRLRFYNHCMDTIRLECKQKHGEMICKESKFITPEQYEMMFHKNYEFMNTIEDAVTRKFYTTHITNQMRPVIMIDYDRQAYIHSAGNVRITFDDDLTARLPLSDHTFSILTKKNVILEIKYDNFIPSFITALITGIHLTPQLAVSKYIIAKLALQV